MSSFFGAPVNKGEMKWLISVDDSKAKIGIQGFKKSITDLDSTVKTTNRNLGTTMASSSRTVQTELSKVDQATTSLNTKMQGLGTQTSTVSTNLGSIAGPLQQFGTNTKMADTNVALLGKDMGVLSNNFKPLQGGLTQTSTLMGNTGKQTTSLGQKLSGLKSNFANIGIGLSATVTSAINMGRAWRDLEDTQIAVDKANKKVSTTQEALTKATEAYNLAVKNSGKNSDEAKGKLLDMNQARQAAKIAVDMQAEAEEAQGDAHLNFWTNSIPTILGTMGTFTHLTTTLTGKKDALTKAVGGLSKGFGGLRGAALLLGPALVSMTGPLAGFAGIIIGGGVAIDQLLKHLSDVNPQVKAFTEGQRDFVEGLDEALAKVIPGYGGLKEGLTGVNNTIQEAINSVFPGYITNQEVIAENNKNISASTGDVATKTDELAKATADVLAKEKIRDDALAKYNDKLETRQVGDEKAAKATLDQAEADLKAAKAIEARARAVAGGITTMGTFASAEVELVDTGMDLEVVNTKVTKSVKAMSNETLGILPYTERMNELFSQTSAEVEVAAEEIDAMIDPVRELRLALAANGSTAQNVTNDFNKMFRIHRDQKTFYEAWHRQWGSGAKELNSYEVELSGVDKAMAGTALAADKASQIIQQLVIDTELAGDAAMETSSAWAAFGQTFKKATDLKGALDITFDKDKITRDLVKRLPNHLEKRIKLDLKAEEEATIQGQSIQAYLQGLLEPKPGGGFTWDPGILKIDEKNADKNAREYAETIVEGIDKNTQDPKLKALRENLKKAIDSGADASEIATILGNHVENAPPIKVHVVNFPGNATAVRTELSNEIEKLDPIEIGVIPKFMGSAEVENGDQKWIGVTPAYFGKNPPKGSTGGDTVLDIDRGTNYAQPRNWWEYDSNVKRDKQGNLWRFDPLTGKLTKLQEGAPFNRGIMPDDPAYGRGNEQRPISYGGYGGTNPYSRNPLGSIISGRPGTGSTNQMFGTMPIGQAKGALGGGMAAANPLDIQARQIDQITKNYNMLARAINQTTVNNNALARTIVQLTKNNNVYAQTVVQVTKNHNFLARTIDQITKNNNFFARTVSQLIKNNNTYARTVVEVTKDHNTFGRTQVQLTKNNNTLARTIAQVTTNFKSLKKAIDSVPRKVNIHVSASGPGLKFAQQGMHETLMADTLIYAHKGEKVDIGPGNSKESTAHDRRGGGGGGGGGSAGAVVVEVHNHHDTFTEVRMLKKKLGSGRSVFGP